VGGDIHFDDDENFRRDDDITESNEEGSVSLLKVTTGKQY